MTVERWVGEKGDVGHSPPVWCPQHMQYCTDAETKLHKFFKEGEPALLDMTRRYHEAHFENEHLTKLVGTFGHRLRDIVNLIRGKPPELCLWSTHDAVKLVAEVMTEHEGMQMLLRADLEMYKAINALARVPMPELIAAVTSTIDKLDQAVKRRHTWGAPRE